MIWSVPEHPDKVRQKSGVEEEWWSLTGLITAWQALDEEMLMIS